VSAYLELYRSFDAPYEKFDGAMLGPEFPAELDLVSRLWFRCGYRPGIGAYLNFFLLRDFIRTHDRNFPPRFASFRAMADSFYRTDLFIRDVTDSGAKATGGISSARVREMLRAIQERHVKVQIPPWMQTYFGWSLVENVEKQCAPLTNDEKRLHLSYMAKAYRIMGLRFSTDRAALDRFARAVEAEHAALTENVEKHSRHILRIGEMIGVPSSADSILPMLPPATRAAFEPLYPKVRPGALRTFVCRILGRLLLPKAIGQPRPAIPAVQ
jgi:hypothetical protein